MAAEGAPSHSDHIQDRVGDGGFSFAGDEKCFAANVSPPAANFDFEDREVELVDTVLCRFLSDGALWSDQSLTPNHSTISQAIESPSSLSGSTISADKPECEYYRPWGATATSGYSSHEPSVGPCDRGESEDPSVLMKRLMRAERNRAAAKRSRIKKQAHQQKLELEVEHLGQSKAALWKQLQNVSRQFRDSVTICRVLRSDVDAKRAEVKLAEEIIAGSSLTSSFNHQLQLQLQSRHSTSPHLLNPLNNTCPPPTVAAHGDDDDAFYTRMAVSGGLSAALGPN